MHQLLVEEQRIEIQNEHAVEMQEELSEINTEAQKEVIKAQNDIDEESEKDPKAKQSKKKAGSVATGRGAGRPNLTGRKWDANGNYEGRNGWEKWDASH